MKEITSNKKYVLSLVDPDEVFDILGKSDGKGLFCRCIKGKYQAATHELKYLKVADIKNYIEDAKNNDPNEFIIFYRVAEKTTKDDSEDVLPPCKELLTFNIDGIDITIPRAVCWKAKQVCSKGCDLTTYCPFFGRRNIEVGTGCRRILDAYANGQYKAHLLNSRPDSPNEYGDGV